MKTDMDDYAVTAISKFNNEYYKKLHHVTSPYLSSEEFRELAEEQGIFGASAASHVATLLFFRPCRTPRLFGGHAALVLCGN